VIRGGLPVEQGQGIDGQGVGLSQVVAQGMAHLGDGHGISLDIERRGLVSHRGPVFLGPAPEFARLLGQVPDAQERHVVLVLYPVLRRPRFARAGERGIVPGFVPGQFRCHLFAVRLELVDDFLAEGVRCLWPGVGIVRQERARLPLDQRGRHMEPLDIEVQVCKRSFADVAQEPGRERR